VRFRVAGRRRSAADARRDGRACSRLRTRMPCSICSTPSSATEDYAKPVSPCSSCGTAVHAFGICLYFLPRRWEDGRGAYLYQRVQHMPSASSVTLTPHRLLSAMLAERLWRMQRLPALPVARLALVLHIERHIYQGIVCARRSAGAARRPSLAARRVAAYHLICLIYGARRIWLACCCRAFTSGSSLLRAVRRALAAGDGAGAARLP